jgi:[glutamine synthetase] adenylyltransferase / [glutamine synthetase]-adenylyl-L-tyrosine phosphorylase
VTAISIERVPFNDLDRARANAEAIRARVPAAITELLPTLLADSPDPDGAINLFERLTASAEGELLRALNKHHFLIHYAIVVFGNSQFLGETLLQNTDLFQAFVRDKKLDRTRSREEFAENFARFRSRSLENDISLLLARFKRREYVRIMLRDILGTATLAETTGEISALSDVLIEQALAEATTSHQKRYGAAQKLDAENRLAPVPFAALSMGKLGGNELNYSSDVDLLFVFGDGEGPADAAISNREYFIRLAQATTEILSRPTNEGAVFRIDLRLRPQGREGEPAVSLKSALRYYAEVAHDWELQALLKVRHSAGDQALAREFIRGVQPRVYSPHVNFAAIETAFKSLEKIGARRKAALVQSSGIDVKLDRGGIRDIEFLVQCLQRVYGGTEKWLRSGSTMFSLQKLHDKRHLSGKDFHDLSSAYEFFRRVEHYLQLRRGQQTHRVPEDELERTIVARTLKLDNGNLHAELEKRMLAVQRIYQRVIHSEESHAHEEAGPGEFQLRPPEAGREVSNEHVLQRLAEDSPELHEIASRRDLSARTRRNLHRFLSAAFTSSERYAAALRSPRAVESALRVFELSDHLTDILVRYPEEVTALDEVAAATGAPPEQGLFPKTINPAFVATSDPIIEFLKRSDESYTESLAVLRRHFRQTSFRSAVLDVMSGRNVYLSLFDSSGTAETAIHAATVIAKPPDGLAILALGRLATYEFDLASDVDLLFVRSDNTDPKRATAAAEQIIEILTAYTREGTVFSVDARLRPHGAEGELVTTPTMLERYFADEAQAWEALGFHKLRHIAGNEETARQAQAAGALLTRRFAKDPTFPAAVRDMRDKLEKSDSDKGNFKTGRGGYYDIDFLAGTLAVQQEWESSAMNIRDRLYRLAAAGLLDDGDCATLEYSAELLRVTEHSVRLHYGRSRKSLPATEQGRHIVERLTAKMMRRSFEGGLEAELTRVREQVREVFLRVLA